MWRRNSRQKIPTLIEKSYVFYNYATQKGVVKPHANESIQNTKLTGNVLLTFLNCYMSTFRLVHYALLQTPACWKSSNTNARLMAFVPVSSELTQNAERHSTGTQKIIFPFGWKHHNCKKRREQVTWCFYAKWTSTVISGRTRRKRSTKSDLSQGEKQNILQIVPNMLFSIWGH